MEEVNKQEEVLGYELTTQMDVLLRKVEKHVFNPHYLEDRDKRDLENLVALVRQELMNGEFTKEDWIKRVKNQETVEAKAFEAGRKEGLRQSLANFALLSTEVEQANVAKMLEETILTRKELDLLEDRVTDMETRMLGASLSPHEEEEG